MRFSFLLYFFIITCHCQVIAQSVVSGKVLNNLGKPLPLATVKLINQMESQLVNSKVVDNNGQYTFENLPNGSYLLIATLVGYGPDSLSILCPLEPTRVYNLKLFPKTIFLDSITIERARPLKIQQQLDRKSIDVSESSLTAGTSILELLQQIPGIVNTTNGISIAGKGKPEIMIDGKNFYSSDVMQAISDLSASNVLKVEIIENPGAKYDASGGGIINIITKKKQDNVGTKGDLSLTSGVGLYNKKQTEYDRIFYRLNPSIALYHKTMRTMTYGNYSFYQRSQFEKTDFDRIVKNNRFIQNNFNPGLVKSHSVKLGLDFDLDSKNTIGGVFNVFFRTADRSLTNTTNQYSIYSGGLLGGFSTSNNTSYDRRDFSGNFYWEHTFKNNLDNVILNIDYGKFNSDNYSSIINIDRSNAKNIKEQSIENPVKLWAMKIDYTKFFNKNSRLESGAKVSIVKINNMLDFKQEGILDGPNSGNYIFNETVNSFYLMVTHELSSWQMQAGLRGEHSITKGVSHDLEILDLNYFQLFPSFSISRPIAKDFKLNLQYSRRINRPNYNQQSPFVQYLDSLTFMRGNPFIRPEILNEIKLSLNYRTQPFISIGLIDKQNAIIQNAPHQEGNFTYTSPENLSKFKNVLIEVYVPLSLNKRITGYLANQFIYNYFKSNYLLGLYENSKWNYQSYLSLDYKITKKTGINLSGFYLTNSLNEFLLLKHTGMLNLGIQQKVLKGRGKISLATNDIFNTYRINGTLQYQDINFHINRIQDTRNVRFTFTYNFGSNKTHKDRERVESIDNERKRLPYE
ncbi:outer membrane beta-barrel protein [Sphingobacterium kitahiroshimense]|uniref:Outer membrane beta-barrel protein n=1 Tax=Sphingobacterium kitahiroshimense TaxID=470446 RepID=A0ABV0BXF2_9SPHI